MSNNDPTSRRPIPTRLILLDQAAQQEPGTKIRVLACVHAYHPTTATLTLKLHHPNTNRETPTLLATLTNIVDNVDHDALQIGSWLNVVGYMQKPRIFKTRSPASASCSSSTAAAASSAPPHRSKPRSYRRIPVVDVLMIWSAGAVKLVEYQSAVRSFQGALPID